MDQEHGLGDAAGEKANLRLGNVSNGYGGRTVEDHGLAMSVRRRKIVALCGAGKVIFTSLSIAQFMSVPIVRF